MLDEKGFLAALGAGPEGAGDALAGRRGRIGGNSHVSLFQYEDEPEGREGAVGGVGECVNGRGMLKGTKDLHEPGVVLWLKGEAGSMGQASRWSGESGASTEGATARVRSGGGVACLSLRRSGEIRRRSRRTRWRGTARRGRR